MLDKSILGGLKNQNVTVLLEEPLGKWGDRKNR